MEKSRFSLVLIFSLSVLSGLCLAKPELRWWKGNLHTHTFWSDGRDYPEMVVDWYKNHGYHFLALSDHNILSQGSKWIDVERSEKLAPGFLNRYIERFGKDWVQLRESAGKQQVRLKPLSEYRCLFEEPNRFLLIQAEEISDKNAHHLGAINLLETIPPQGGATSLEILQNNVNAVLDQRERTGQIMFPHINHPNFHWALTAEDMMQVEGENFFEIFNGHPSVNNQGNKSHAATERMWDIILTRRLAELKMPVMYGIATDDAHIYQKWNHNMANPGRGWIMVQTDYLTPESIITAMEKGDFYSSTGVSLKDVKLKDSTLSIEVEPQKDLSYTIRFIGTRKGCDTTGSKVFGPDGKPLHTTLKYSDQIGETLKEIKGTAASYTFTGDELYVRAKVISSKLNKTLSSKGEFEAAWIQPVVLEKQ